MDILTLGDIHRDIEQCIMCHIYYHFFVYVNSNKVTYWLFLNYTWCNRYNMYLTCHIQRVCEKVVILILNLGNTKIFKY